MGSTVSGKGYGSFTWSEKGQKSRCMAHRYGWFATYGEWPKLFLLHQCDNRKCVNPSHLREGTQKENGEDLVLRGWPAKRKPLPREVFDTIQNLLKDGRSFVEIEAETGVHWNIIQKIKKGIHWTCKVYAT